MTSRSRTVTERLTGEKVFLTLDDSSQKTQRGKRFWLAAVVAVVAAGAVFYFAGSWMRAALSAFQAAIQDKQVLMQELADVRQELGSVQRNWQIEVSTRRELEESITDLTTQLKAAQVELEFMKTNGASGAAGTQAAQ